MPLTSFTCLNVFFVIYQMHDKTGSVGNDSASNELPLGYYKPDINFKHGAVDK